MCTFTHHFIRSLIGVMLCCTTLSARNLISANPFHILIKNTADNTYVSDIGSLLTPSTYEKRISGKVTDDNKEPLPGVNVVVKGTTTGTVTDVDGNFQLSAPDNAQTLVFSSVGFVSKEVSIGNQSVLDVQMEPDVKALSEVVVVGYGTQKKEDLTGSVASVTSEDLKKVPVNTPDQAMQGRVAGVQVRTNSHAPGGSISVRVRGTSSISASGQPLYVIDGYPITNDFIRSGDAGGDGGQPNPLNSLDPSNIASIEILKDASATAIYGSRATNGVVLITTKRGQSGQSSIDFETQLAIQQPIKTFDMINATQWANLVNEAADLNNQVRPFTDEQVASFGKGTNWQDEVYRKALNQRYKLTFSGGTDKLRYLLSGGYMNQDGILTGSNFKRYSTNINLDNDINEKFTIGSSLMFTNTIEQIIPTDAKGYGTQPGIIPSILTAPPTIPPYDEDGNPTVFSNYTLGGGKENPLFMATQYDLNANTVRLIGSVFGDYEILDGLNLKVRVGTDYRDWRYKAYYPIVSLVSSGRGGVASQISERTVNFLNENTLTYQKTIGEKHNLTLLAGYTYQQERDESLRGEAYGFPSDYYKYNNLSLASTPQSPGSGASKWTLVSYIGRLNYSFNNRYLITATARMDGSSKFGTNNKYGFFPSVAVAWKLDEEQFIQNLNTFSQLKLRVGYGNTGNERIGLYNSLSTISTSRTTGTAYVFDDQMVPVAYPSRIANPDLSWEKSRDVNIGLDLGFFQNRLSFTIDAYQKKTTDLLLNVPLPTQSGFGSVLKNIGSIENKGIEFSVQSVNLKGPLSWNTNINFSLNRNKVLDLGGAPFLFDGWAGGGNMAHNGTQVVRLEPGKPVGLFFGAVADGIWHSQEEINEVGTMPAARPGDMRFEDMDGDGVFTASDDQYVGDPNPDFTYGFNNDFTYKQWSLNIFMYGEYGADILFLTKNKLAGGTNQLASDRLNRWTPEHPENDRLGAASGYPSLVSTDNVVDGSFLRVKNIALSYSLPVGRWNVSWLRTAQITIAADNPFTFTKYPGYDPEVNSYGESNTVRGLDRFSYPAVQAYRVGINIGL